MGEREATELMPYIKYSRPFFHELFSNSVRRFLVQSLKVAPLALIALIGSGCGRVTVNFDVDASKIDANRQAWPQVPVSIGVYYPPTTRNYIHRIPYTIYDVQLGDMLVRFWNELFSKTFDKTILLEQHSIDSPPANLRADAIIEVRLDSYRHTRAKATGGSWTGDFYVRGASAGILFAFVLRCPDGAQVAERSLHGYGKMAGSKHSSPSIDTQVRATLDSAFLDAGQKFLDSSLPAQLETLECPG